MHAEYSSFELRGSEYRIFISGYQGNAGDPLRLIFKLMKRSLLSFFSELTMAWDFLPKTWIGTIGPGVAQIQEVMVVGGSMDVA